MQGLLAAYLLDGAGGGSTLDWRETMRWQPERGLLWMHMNYSEPSVQNWLGTVSGLDPIIVQALCAEETRPRTILLDSGLFMVLRGVNQNPGAEPEDMVSIRIWVEQGRILSTCQRVLQSEQDLESHILNHQGPRNAADFLVDLSYLIVERLADVVEDIDNLVLAVEERVDNGQVSGVRDSLASVRKTIIALKRYLSPQRDAMTRVQHEYPAWFTDRDRLHLREISDRLVRCIEDLDEAREQVNVIQEQLASQISEQTNRRIYTLSLVAAIFLPLTFVTGLFGINVGGIPGGGNAQGFLWISLALAGLATVLLLVFKRRHWF